MALYTVEFAIITKHFHTYEVEADNEEEAKLVAIETYDDDSFPNEEYQNNVGHEIVKVSKNG